MTAKDNKRQRQLLTGHLARLGGLVPGATGRVSHETGVPEAEIYGVGSFFHLLATPSRTVRICSGLSCQLAGSADLLDLAKKSGMPAVACGCLAACDKPTALLRERDLLTAVETSTITRADEKWQALTTDDDPWRLSTAPAADKNRSVFNLAGDHLRGGSVFEHSLELGATQVMALIEASGLQGRGGAGFPAASKWRAVASQPDPERYLVLNADEGEPGTFKDRDLLLNRPDLVLEGLAIAAAAVGANDVYCYLRGEFARPWQVLEDAIADAAEDERFRGLRFHLHAGHGAYICGEETALLEALEGKRGMPRHKPPYPTESGLWGKPTLIHNVETIACVPAIIQRGAGWFRQLGRTAPGTKLYSVSGHVARPGTYELPLGVCLDELVAVAGGYVGTLKAFSPGGASSGFLPASERTRPLDFAALSEVGSMLGSAGVVVLNRSVDLRWAARVQLAFFEAESCGQCAPCRIGTRFLRERLDDLIAGRDPCPGSSWRTLFDDVAWEMNEGSICGLGQAAPLPLTSALRWFPEEFDR